MKHDGDDWQDLKYGGHVTRTARQEDGFTVASCPCGWQRVASTPAEASQLADRHERRRSGLWFLIS